MSDAVDSIINGHVTSIEALREEVQNGKNAIEELERTKSELKELKAKDTNPDAYKKKYDELKSEYESYKDEVGKKETHRTKTAAYRKAILDAGVSEKLIDKVLKVSDIDTIELDEDGKLKDVEKITNSIKEEWKDFIVSTDKGGSETDNPPGGDGGGTPKTLPSIF